MTDTLKDLYADSAARQAASLKPPILRYFMNPDGTPKEDANGVWVTAADYQRVADENKLLRVKYDEMREFVKQWHDQMQEDHKILGEIQLMLAFHKKTETR